MITKNQINEREQLFPPNHLVPKLDAAPDFSFIYPLVEATLFDFWTT